jgi:two-component system, sensor histidine kinase
VHIVGKTMKILVADDQRQATIILEKLLDRFGHTVCVVEDGPAAVQQAKEFAPQAVFCDIEMPGMDGYQVAQAMRADPQLASLYLVAVSGHTEEEDRRRAAQAGFDYYVTKPIDIEQFRQILATFPRSSPPKAGQAPDQSV